MGFMWTIEVLGNDPSGPYKEFDVVVGIYADVEGVEAEDVEAEDLKFGFTRTLFCGRER